MSETYEQNATGAMTYPAQGTLNRVLFKTPLIWWRMGLGTLVGRSMLVLTTWGRRSKTPRHTMLSSVAHGGQMYVVSGWGECSDWYRNTLADPRVTVQTAERTYGARARRVSDVEEFTAVERIVFQTGGDTHFRPWLASLGIAYDLDDLIAKRDRVHLVALDPSDEPGPPPLPIDLTWVWPAILASFAAGWVLGRLGSGR